MSLGALVLAGLIATSSPTLSQSASSQSYSLMSVEVMIAEDAFVDWNPAGSPGFELQDQFITQIFSTGAQDGGGDVLIGPGSARMTIEVVRFDILSDLEKFFCCAKNEVSAFIDLTDAETGAVLIPRTLVNFDHFARGGVFAAFSAINGGGQIDRLIEIISENTEEWLGAAS